MDLGQYPDTRFCALKLHGVGDYSISKIVFDYTRGS